MQHNILLFVVFITGAALLIIEVVATRILSPYYGNTIFTFSSVIGVVLAFLSLGYIIGGRLADRRPDSTYLYGIILASGCSVALLSFLTTTVLPWYAYDFSITAGPLLFSLLLFALPSLLIGMLSPYVITLQQKACPRTGLGTVAGTVFCWSTVGSIVGSLSTGFLLIPFVGVQEIVISVAFVLIIIGLIGLSLKMKQSIYKVGAFLIALCFFFIATSAYGAPLPSNILYSEDGTYEQIRVLEAIHESRLARVLFLDRTSSTALFLDDPEELLFPYTEFYKLYTILPEPIDNALVLGAGAYVIPEVFHRELPHIAIDVVDIEEKLLAVATEYFGYSNPPEISSHVEDGRRFLHDSAGSYDFIFGDVFSSGMSIPSHMATQEFFTLVSDRLSDDGVFMGNFIGTLSDDQRSIIPSLIKTFATVFNNIYIFSSEDQGYDEVQNVAFVAFAGDTEVDFCSTTYTRHRDSFFQGLCNRLVDLSTYDLSQQIVLTDNYAPVEYLTSSWAEKVH
ncbi:MAG: fused MFS/spermidine synthase [bacterium]|nr:fused MFS/spermidine synthase [bacterium]